MTRKRKIILGIVCVGIGGAMVAGIVAYKKATRSISEGYALWAASEAIIAYHWSTSSWPQSWNDLEDYYRHSRHAAGHSLEDLEALVAIEFNEIQASLSRSIEEIEFGKLNDQIRLRSGSDGVWRRPEEIFADYMEDSDGFARRKSWPLKAEQGTSGDGEYISGESGG